MESPHKQSRTTEVPIQTSDAAPIVHEPHYQLHIGEAKAPNEGVQKVSQKQDSREVHIPGVPRVSSPKSARHRFWSVLEYLATSALIFVVLFFVLNYQAYTALFVSKIEQIWGTSGVSDPIESSNLKGSGEKVAAPQSPLPLAPAPDQAKKQVPPLNLAITPPDNRIVIRRINKNVPIVKVDEENLLRRDWGALEKDIQLALRDGVVHYPRTALPGSHGNVVITGHSSYFSWDPGRFKDVFALLHQVNVGDEITVYYEQQKYTYRISEKKVVTPDQVDVLTQEGEERLTLITCTPVGTNLKRLIVLAKPVD